MMPKYVKCNNPKTTIKHDMDIVLTIGDGCTLQDYYL